MGVRRRAGLMPAVTAHGPGVVVRQRRRNPAQQVACQADERDAAMTRSEDHDVLFERPRRSWHDRVESSG